MQLYMIQSFLQLCNDSNISKSSRKLNISQQGLSRQLKAMETELGVALFDRSRHGLILTPEGEKLRPYFEEIDRQYSAALSAIHIKQKDEPIRLGFTYSSTYATGLNFVLSYQNSHPGSAVQISSLSNEDCEEKLLSHDLDAALITSPKNFDAFNKILVFESPAYAVVNKNHRFAKRSSISLSELAGETVYMPDKKYRMRQLFDECYKDIEKEFKSIFSSSEHIEYVKLPADTYGIALTFLFLCDNLGPKLAAIPIAENFPARMYFCTNKDTSGNPALNDFTSYVKRTLGILKSSSIP